MSTTYEIPLISLPQKFFVSLAGVSYELTLRWCAPGAAWTLDIAGQSGEPMVQGLPLVTGIDILGQSTHLGIGGQLYVATDHDTWAPPTSQNLGSQSHLYFVTTP